MGVTRQGAFTTPQPVEDVLDLQPAGSQSGLAADSTGIKFTANRDFSAERELLEKVVAAFLELSKDSSATDETVTLELFNVTAGTVDASVAITGASQWARSSNVLANIQMGDIYRVRWNVTTASSTSGATFDADSASLINHRQLS